MVGETLFLAALVYIDSVCVESNDGGSVRCRGPTRLRWVWFSLRCSGCVHRREVLVALRVEGYGLVFALQRGVRSAERIYYIGVVSG